MKLFEMSKKWNDLFMTGIGIFFIVFGIIKSEIWGWGCGTILTVFAGYEFVKEVKNERLLHKQEEH